MTAKAGTVVILDGSGSLAAGEGITWDIKQAETDVAKVALTDVPNLKYSKQFTMPDTPEVLDFSLTISNTTSSDIESVMVQRIEVIPPPPPTDVDAFGMKMLFKPTANKVAMEKGTIMRTVKDIMSIMNSTTI